MKTRYYIALAATLFGATCYTNAPWQGPTVSTKEVLERQEEQRAYQECLEAGNEPAECADPEKR